MKANHPSNPNARAWGPLLAALLVTAAVGAGHAMALPSAGGTVTDRGAAIVSFAGDRDAVDNSGLSSEVFSGELFDSNGEHDLRQGTIVVDVTGPVSFQLTHVILANEFETGDEPAWSADGWKIWSGTHNDGNLSYRLRHVFPAGAPAGTYTFTISFTHRDGTITTGPSDQTLVTLFSGVSVAGEPVGADGLPLGLNWGLWTAQPGSRNVESRNYVKLVNTGTRPDASAIVDFSASHFLGADGRGRIPIDGNVQFAWCEVASSDVPPRECTFTFGDASATGTQTVTFTGTGKVVYVAYRIVQVPTVLKAQGYSAAFTVDTL